MGLGVELPTKPSSRVTPVHITGTPLVDLQTDKTHEMDRIAVWWDPAWAPDGAAPTSPLKASSNTRSDSYNSTSAQ